MNTSWEARRKRIYRIIEVGNNSDHISRGYDFLNTLCILLNLTASILYTFQEFRAPFGEVLLTIESITVAGFAVDFVLRVWTAPYLYPHLTGARATRKYLCSLSGIIDLLSFLPYYLPFFFPTGAAAFRMFRIVRIFRLFRINAYYDSLNVITEVIVNKSQQLISSVFIIMVLMLASSLCMYSLEHEAQPEVFSNAFSGIWWSVSTLLTVGYGDIYPITPMGKVFSIFITFLGVGMVAIPTGIISAGFVDQYSQIKRISEYGEEESIHFIKIHLTKHDSWVNRSLAELALPGGIIVAAVRRGRQTLVPHGQVTLKADDILILGAESYQDREHIDLKEVELKKHHPWNGQYIRDLDISRQTFIVLIKREDKPIIPNGNTQLMEGDMIILYTQQKLPDAKTISL